jgi:Tfp pilus assembly protein PilV
MLEVLVAILVITFFLAGTLQLMAIDTLYKLLAKQQANAAQWIQEDVEEVRALAVNVTRTSNPAIQCRPSTISSDNNYASVLQSSIAGSTTLPGSTNKALVSPNGKLYRMDRTFATVTPSEPNVLKITYSVVDIEAESGADQDINRTANRVIARFYTEIIPPDSFQCP